MTFVKMSEEEAVLFRAVQMAFNITQGHLEYTVSDISDLLGCSTEVAAGLRYELMLQRLNRHAEPASLDSHSRKIIIDAVLDTRGKLDDRIYALQGAVSKNFNDQTTALAYVMRQVSDCKALLMEIRTRDDDGHLIIDWPIREIVTDQVGQLTGYVETLLLDQRESLERQHAAQLVLLSSITALVGQMQGVKHLGDRVDVPAQGGEHG
ncbi:hypothetical protein [Paraburkholderia xenovorans]